MNDTNDQKWRHVLKLHDPATRPAAVELAALEHRIMSRLDALPDRFMPSGIAFAPWVIGGNWAMRGACFAAMLFVLLGFLVGREFDNLSFQTGTSGTLFASAEGTPWQSFITSPASGETDDAQ